MIKKSNVFVKLCGWSCLATICLLGACQKQTMGLPDLRDVEQGNVLPLDGLWRMQATTSLVEGTETVRFSKGTMSTVDVTMLVPGLVLTKSLAPLDDNRYAGTRLYSDGSTLLNARTVLTVVSPTQMVEHVEVPSGQTPPMIVDVRYTIVSLDNLDAFRRAHSNARGPEDPSAPSMELDLTTFEEERHRNDAEEYIVAKGATIEVERSRTIEYSVAIEATSGDEVQLEAKYGTQMYRYICGTVKAKIETKLGRQLQESETFRVKATLDGAVSETWRLVWIDRYVCGVARFTDENGKPQEVRFRMKKSSDLEATPAI